MVAGRQAARTALHGNAFPVAVHVFSGDWGVLEGEAHVVGDEQVEVAVAVVIHKAATRAPAGLVVPQPGRLGHIGEGAVTIVAEEAILAVVRAEDIFESVVVVVADTHSGSPSG